MEFKVCDTIGVIAYDIRATFEHPDYSSKLVWAQCTPMMRTISRQQLGRSVSCGTSIMHTDIITSSY